MSLMLLALVISLLPGPAFAQTGFASISGRTVDAETGEPLRGNTLPNTRVNLELCSQPFSCNYVSQAFPDSFGVFQFTNSFGSPLTAGNYRITVTADGYNTTTRDFALTEGQALNLGDVAVLALPTIGSISGKARAAVTGEPIYGNESPFGRAELRLCINDNFCNYVAEQSLDSNGRYRFTRSDSFFTTLTPGTYEVVVSSREHVARSSGPFQVLEDQNVQLPTFVLAATLPVRFTEVRPCGDLPPEGGDCRFSLRIENVSPDDFVGSVWNVVEIMSSSFQLNGSHQSQKPNPLNIPRNGSIVVPFLIRIPAIADDGQQICANVHVGRGTQDFYFDVQRRSDLFCIVKGQTGSPRPGYSLMSAEDMQRLDRQPGRSRR